VVHINIDAIPTLSTCHRLFIFSSKFPYYVSPPLLPSQDSLLMAFRLLLKGLVYPSYRIWFTAVHVLISHYQLIQIKNAVLLLKCTSSTAMSHTQTNHNTAPLRVRRSSRRYIEGDCKSKYCITGNFYSQISMALNEGGAISGFNCITICLDARSGSINPYTSLVNPAS
jgi:hypothetical protein